MKNRIPILIFLLIALLFHSGSWAQTTWNTGNPITVAWDAVSPFNDGNTVQYQLYIRTDPSGSEIPYGSPTAQTQATITFTGSGGYFDIGVQAQELSGGSVIDSSSISWSNNFSSAQNGAVFGEAYAVAGSYNATPSVSGANVSISPTTAQTVNYGATTQFTITPNTGYLASVSGTCGGALVGTTYTTNPISQDCTVIASASPVVTYTVSTSAGVGGSINPTSQTINSGSQAVFLISPNSGYSIASVTGCGGSLSGSTYTTGAITSNCTVTASFYLSSLARPTGVRISGP